MAREPPRTAPLVIPLSKPVHMARISLATPPYLAGAGMQQVHNVSFAFELMLDGGLRRPKARPEDVVNLDLKSTLRVLYNLFTKYKNVE